jgi:diguanylate cyclase (GGDEF)-like protein
MNSLKDKISVEIKSIVIMCILTIIGTLSFIDGGFNSGGIILILLSNVIAVILLPKLKSIIVFFLSIGILIALWIYAKIYKCWWTINVRYVEWIIQFVIFLLFLIILQGMIHAIRNYLLGTILAIEKNSEITYKIAYYDELTGLPNQKLFKKQLLERVSEKESNGFIILYKLKNLNLINSIYGDTIGDEIVVEVANVFSRIKKESNLLGRISGNEFAIWVENVSQRELKEWLDYTNKVFESGLVINNINMKPGFYVSYAEYNEKYMSIEECYQKASISLTYAKKNNKLGIIEYNKNFEEVIRKDEEMKELLESALVKEEFELYYQTKVDARTGEVDSLEALARWKTPKHGIISPDIFIPIIERMNKSIVFGELIIKKVFMDYKKLCVKYGKEIKVSINISPSHLMSEGFVGYISEMIEKYEIKGEDIIIEITEEVIIEGVCGVNKILKAIHEIGVSIAIDDFGKGYSSFNYLMNLDVNELKIDKSFIDELGKNNKINTVLEGIIYVAKGLNFNLVAEGVETKEQCIKLVHLGCFVIQGYYYSKPEPIDINENN